MHSPGQNLNRRQITSVASRIQLFERLSKTLTQPSRNSRLRSSATSASGVDSDLPSKPATLNLRTHFQCAYGEELKVVGNSQELGNWDVDSAPKLNWTNGDSWTGQVELKKPDAAHFKLVFLSHGGVVWEPVSDRKLETLPASEVNVEMAWGTEGVQVASEQPEARQRMEACSAADEFDLLWNPVDAGNAHPSLPPSSPKIKDRSSAYDVTLEPEWGVLDLDTPLESSSGTGVESNPDNVAQSPASEDEGRGLIKKKKKSKSNRSYVRQPFLPAEEPKKGIDSVIDTARNLAVGTLAATTLAAVGVHGQDLLMGTFSIATGAAVLQRAVEVKKGLLESEARETVLSVILGIGQTALKAASLFNAAKESWQKGSQQTSAPVQQEAAQESEESETVEVPDLSLLEEELAEYVAALAQEATEFAMKYSPTQEDLFEASMGSQIAEKEAVKQEDNVSNIVSAKFMNTERSAV